MGSCCSSELKRELADIKINLKEIQARIDALETTAKDLCERERLISNASNEGVSMRSIPKDRANTVSTLNPTLTKEEQLLIDEIKSKIEEEGGIVPKDTGGIPSRARSTQATDIEYTKKLDLKKCIVFINTSKTTVKVEITMRKEKSKFKKIALGFGLTSAKAEFEVENGEGMESEELIIYHGDYKIIEAKRVKFDVSAFVVSDSEIQSPLRCPEVVSVRKDRSIECGATYVINTFMVQEAFSRNGNSSR